MLAAGMGSRLAPLTDRVPKPALPVDGTPAILRILAMLADWGVRDVVVNLHRGAPVLFDLLRRSGPPGLRLTLSFEPHLLGTGGALSRASWFFSGHTPFWIVNADVVAQVRPDAFVRSYLRHRPLAAVWLTDTAGPRTVDVEDGRVLSFRSQSPGAPGTFTFCGLHLVAPHLLGFLPHHGPADIIAAYEEAMRRGESVRAVSPPRASWGDIGTVAGYLDAHRLPPRKGAPGSFVSTGTGVRVARSATVNDCVLLDGAVVHARANVRNTVAGPGAHLYGPVSGLALAATDMPGDSVPWALGRLQWPTDRVLALPLPARGSDRMFTRLRYRSRSVVLVSYSAAREENRLYAGHARFLHRIGFPVPAVLADSPTHRATVLADLGERSLEEYAQRCPPARLSRMYRRVLEHVALLHSEGLRRATRSGRVLAPPFSARLYRWEHDLFIEQYVRGLRGNSRRRVVLLRRELTRIARFLHARPGVLVHRDLQSSNIFLVRQKPFFVDFQGMRRGAAAYDLASLLCDPYVSLPLSMQRECLAAYASIVGPGSAPDAEAFWMAAVQRLVQALGAFARLGRIPATARFLAHIPPALDMLDRALANTRPFPYLREWVTKERQKEVQP